MRTIKTLVPALVLLLIPAFLVKRYLVHPSPRRILTNTLQRYGAFEFYSDTTTVRSGIPSLEGSYEFTYARPNRLRVQFRGLLNDELVLADGITLYVYRPAANQYRAAPAPHRLPDELPGGQSMLKLSLLNGVMPLHQPGNIRYGGRSKWRGRWIHRVRIEAKNEPPAESMEQSVAPSPQAGRAGVGSAFAAGGIANMVLWIGADDGLIYRTDTTLALGAQTLTQSLEHDGISTAPPPAGTFTFEPPEGARAVARFEGPQLMPGISNKALSGRQEGQY